MGTRGFLGFVVDGVEKISYNHFDSYPGGLGLDVLEWIQGLRDFSKVQAKARALRVVTVWNEDGSENLPTPEDVSQLRRWYDGSVGSTQDHGVTWYQLLRRTQGNPGEILEAGAIEDASKFPTDSLFAEWGYLIDLDTYKFEVYKGFQKVPHESGRFAQRPSPRVNGYVPVKLMVEWSLYDLPTKEIFVATFRADDEEEEDG